MNSIFPPFNNHFYKPYFFNNNLHYNTSTNPNAATQQIHNYTDFQNNHINKIQHTVSEPEEKTVQSQKDKPLMEFGGIQLYHDDLLILLLIYFLYKEKINDKLLLIALFSLLF